VAQDLRANSVIFKKLPKANNGLQGESSPNLRLFPLGAFKITEAAQTYELLFSR
jgi:hypothetical protein